MRETRSLVVASFVSLAPWAVAALTTNWFTADGGTLSQKHGVLLVVLQLIVGLLAFYILAVIDRLRA
jgi:formate hydrogenlyase subunit 4